MKITKDYLKQIIKEELESVHEDTPPKGEKSEFELFHNDVINSFIYMASRDAIFKGNLQQFLMFSPSQRKYILKKIKEKMDTWAKPNEQPKKEKEF